MPERVPDVEFTRHEVVVDGLRVSYRAEPEHDTGTPLVLIHGLGMSSRAFLRVLPWLAGDFRVLAPDLPGCGASEKPHEPMDIAGLTLSVVRWMDTLGIERAHVLGHSVGAQVACELAARHPERVDRLVLAGPTPDVEPVPAWRLAARLLVDGVQEPPFLIVTASADYLRARPSRMWRTLGKALKQDVEARAQRVKARTLVIRGDRDPVARGEWTRTLGELIDDALVVDLPGATHGLQAQSPRDFARSVRDFLLAQ